MTSSTEHHRSASVLASNLSLVMPALCTTTSSPPWRNFACSRMRPPASAEVTRHVGRAADVIGHPCQGISGARHIHAHDPGAVADQDARDLCADPPRRSGHDRHLLGERHSQSTCPLVGAGSAADLDDLQPSTYADRPEEDPQRCGKIGDTGVGDIDGLPFRRNALL